MDTATVLRCATCEAPLEAGSVDLGSGIATCPYCRSVMRFGAPAGGTEVAAERAPIELPEGCVVEDLGGEFRITYRWFSWIVLFLVPFCIGWCSILALWYGGIIGMDGPPFPLKLVFLVLPLVHVAIGVGLAYLCLVLLLNRTTIRVRDGELSITHRPLPWPGGGTFPTAEPEQLYCQSKVTRSEENTKVTYELHAKVKGGGTKKLLTGLHTADAALFLEQRLEKHLKIADRLVAGELPR